MTPQAPPTGSSLAPAGVCINWSTLYAILHSKQCTCCFINYLGFLHICKTVHNIHVHNVRIICMSYKNTEITNVHVLVITSIIQCTCTVHVFGYYYAGVNKHTVLCMYAATHNNAHLHM